MVIFEQDGRKEGRKEGREGGRKEGRKRGREGGREKGRETKEYHCGRAFQAIEQKTEALSQEHACTA